MQHPCIGPILTIRLASHAIQLAGSHIHFVGYTPLQPLVTGVRCAGHSRSVRRLDFIEQVAPALVGHADPAGPMHAPGLGESSPRHVELVLDSVLKRTQRRHKPRPSTVDRTPDRSQRAAGASSLDDREQKHTHDKQRPEPLERPRDHR
jgi:hypothetical protein